MLPGPHLQHPLKQVALAAREASPVGQDEEGQPLQPKLLYRLRRLQR